MTVIQPNEWSPHSYGDPSNAIRPDSRPSRAKDDDELTPSLTGAGNMATALTNRIKAAKARFESANDLIDTAFNKLDTASVAVEKLASKIESEADAALAQIGQVSNMEPE